MGPSRPMMPKSTATMVPALSTSRLPWCMSAWKKPSRMAWRRNERRTVRPSAFRSWPAATSAARSEMGTPSIHSSVSTRLEVRRQSMPGTRRRPSGRAWSPAMLSAISEMAAASRRRSISISTLRASVSTTAIGRSRRVGGSQRSIWRAAKTKASRSRRKRFSMPGRRIFTATSRHTPLSMATALCTWAMEAAATGGPNAAKWSSSRPPSCSSTDARASFIENGGSLSCRWPRSLASSGPMRSARVARNWPSLM